ncbi:hypothetical protein D3C76_1743480 [compost metagenome]
MNASNVRYITVNDSRIVAGGELEIGGDRVSVSDFDFGQFASQQRRVLIGWCSEAAKVKY